MHVHLSWRLAWRALGNQSGMWGIAGNALVICAGVLTFATMPLLLLLTLGLQAATGEVALSDHCSTAWCANDRDNATMRAQSRAIITEQLDARKDCTRRPHLADTVLTVKARGRVGDGIAVVTEMAFDKAWTSARAGDVWVLAWC